MLKLGNKIAILVPGNGMYFSASQKINGKIHPFRRKVYEAINKCGYLCEYIGYGNLQAENLKKYHALFLLNIECLDASQNKIIKNYLKNGGNLIFTYKTLLAQDYGISFLGQSSQKMITLNEKKIGYQLINVSNIIYKINRRYLKGIFPVDKFLKLPMIKVKPTTVNKVVATWTKTGLPALIFNQACLGTMIYFSGILAGAENSLLKYMLSLIRPKDFMSFPIMPRGRRCCVTIFHDYEREFANSKFSKYAEKGLNFILATEKKYNIKATFNIVGKICLSHPESIKLIMQDGHEIASHTFKHETPSKSNYNNLDNSIDLSLEVFKTKFGTKLNGFRSPKSQWTGELIEILQRRGFLWNAEDEEALLPYNLVLDRRLKLLRIPVVGDDFSYINKRIKATEMLKKLKEIVEKGIKENSFIAIGFHPWIEGMKEERLKVFTKFLYYLSSKDEIAVMTFGQVCSEWNNRNGC